MSLADIRARIAAAEQEAGRKAGSVKLVAVSKRQPRPRIEAALAEGQRRFGENQIQEAERRWPELREHWPDLELHLVGGLQTNKARTAVALFDAIHSLDRPKLAGYIADAAGALGRMPDLFVQVNTGEEPQKGGVPPTEADGFIQACRHEYGLVISGLMTIPPSDEEPSLHFALLAKIAERNGIAGLSMGMSTDFETAIEFGATHLRIGTAVFGPREN